MKNSDRRKASGDWGEEKVPALLKKAGFHAVRDLKFEKANHQFANFYAERGNHRFIIGVKTRNRLTAAAVNTGEYSGRTILAQGSRRSEQRDNSGAGGQSSPGRAADSARTAMPPLRTGAYQAV
jgi:hypothetical protein